MSRPEHINPPDLFYDQVEAKKYDSNTRVMEIQTRMAERAVELLNLPRGKKLHILDLGCGSGLSGEVLSEHGHSWVGVDISPSMLGVALEREVEGDLVYADIGQGLFFRAGTFDGCISVSVLQWLCQAETSKQNPIHRLKRFFESLYRCLSNGARAIFQFYPENEAQLRMINTAAMKSGFSGGLVVDYPNSRSAKKVYLCLFAGEASKNTPLPKAKTGMEDDIMGEPAQDTFTTVYMAKEVEKSQERRNRMFKRKKGRERAKVKSYDWVQKKKEQRRRQGKATARDSKYTARSRGPKF